MGILLGYSEVGYRILLNNKIIVARHVDIVEKDVKCIGIDYNDDEKESDCSTDDEVSDNAFESADETNEQKSLHQPSGKYKDDKNNELQISRRSTRDKKCPIRYRENSSNNIYVNFCRVDTPRIHLRRRCKVKIGKIG